MERARQLLPPGLAEMPPGGELAAVLNGIDLSCLSGADCVEVLRARHRLVAHEQAQLMAAMVEVGLCGIGPDDELPRMSAPDEFSADEIRGALAWTRAAASSQLWLAWDLIDRLPAVFTALDAGQIDVPKTKVFSEWTHGLSDEQAREICAQLVPAAPTLTTGQLIDRIKRLAIAVDPDWARRRYEEAVRDRKVVGYRNDDGSANVSGQSLPADRAAAACAHIDVLARRAKRAGDGRPLGHIQADLFLGMLDGSFTGRSEADIIDHLLATATAVAKPTDDSRTTDHGREQDDQDDQDEQTDRTDSGYRGSSTRAIEEPTRDGLSQNRHHRTPPVPRREGVEIRAEITTLLGLDDHPGEIAGWGPVHADVARRLVHDQTAAEWRFAITDDRGRLVHEGITRLRPVGYPARAAAPSRGGVVELQIKLSTLRRLAANPAQLGDWAPLITDLARQTAQRADQNSEPDGQGPRHPGTPLRRRTEIRDRTCVHPGCRAPAHGTDGDHTQDWAYGGATSDVNIGSLCRHDHRLKHEGGWTVQQPQVGHFRWTSRLGRHYQVGPPLIIQPLLNPIPRDYSPPAYPHDDHDAANESIWRELAVPEPELRPPAADPPEEDPPF